MDYTKRENTLLPDKDRRTLAYVNDYENIQFLISVDQNKYTEEEQDDLCKFVMRAIVAYKGFLRNEKKIGEICGLVSFGIPDRITKILGKGIIQKVREAFAYALALVLGYDYYNQEFEFTSIFPEVHFGKPKER
jgi:hypothetical protein